MTELLFFHLDKKPLDRALPELLEKSLERGWRVVVEAGSQERRDALDAHLWTYSDESFLPHGTDQEPDAAAQPVLLTVGPSRANDASVRFLVDRAPLPDRATLETYQRVVYLFDGHDPDALNDARAAWRQAKAMGVAAQYWAQNERGAWVKKDESKPV